MDIALWIAQILMGLAFILAGWQHGFRYEQARTQMTWMNSVPKNLTTFIGAAEILGGIGLILPALTGVLPWLTPLAATGLAIIMLLAMGFHLMRREYSAVLVNFVLFLLVGFIAVGRWMVVPL